MVVWNDFRNGVVQPGFGFSTDFGVTWTASVKTPLPTGYNRGFDPSCAINRSGRAFYCYAAAKPYGGTRDTARRDIFVAFTNTNGAPWVDSILSRSLTYKTEDKPFMAIDNTGGTKDGYLYVSWITASDPTFGYSAVMFSRSSDAGIHWSSPQILGSESDPGANAAVDAYPDSAFPQNTLATHYYQFPTPVVASNGDVYVLWADVQDNGIGPPVYNGSTYRIRKSVDGGVTFGTTYAAANFTFKQTYFNGTNISTWTHLDIRNVPSIVCDASTAGKLYLVYPDTDAVSQSRYRLRIAVSSDSGKSWTPPTIFGDNIGSSSTRWQFFPWISTQASGTLSVLYLHAQDSLKVVDVYMTQSTNQGWSWIKPIRVTSQSIDPSKSRYSHHYMGLVSALNYDFPAWTDYRTVTGNGAADIYYNKPLTLPYTAVGNWNMLGVPDTVSNFAKNVVWLGSSSNATRWDTNSGGYVVADPLKIQDGYFIKFPADSNVRYIGVPIFSLTMNVGKTAQTGWNLIGSISKSIATSAIVQSPSGIVVNNVFYKYNPGSGYQRLSRW